MTSRPNPETITRKRPGFWAVAYAVILVLAVLSRLYLLGERATSHDETTHALFSWNFYSGNGFRHDPMMHGPLLFEASGLFYFLFGVSDFTARLYTALTGVALVLAPWLLRKWLGKAGALAASVMLLISPSIAYYSRYTRHDIPLILYAVLLLWCVLQYLDEGKRRWLYGMAIFFPLMYASKENAYIYTALFLGLLALPFAWQIFSTRWQRRDLLTGFVIAMAVILVLGGIFALALQGATVEPKTEEGESTADLVNISVPWWGRVALGLAFALALALLPVIYYGVGEEAMRRSRLFDVLMALGTLTLPLGSAFLMKFIAGVNMNTFYPALMAQSFKNVPLAWTFSAFAILTLTLAASAVLGVWWNRRDWPILALLHYAIFFVLYSSVFTWGYGALTGLVGGLAYWMSQQGVERGSQPWFYYGLIGPIYEYMAILLASAAGLGGVAAVIRRLILTRKKSAGSDANTTQEKNAAPPALPAPDLPLLFPLFLLFWTWGSWVAYTYAGEKMPWLFTHIALPNVLLAAWGVGQCAHGLRWRDLTRRYGWVLPLGLVLLGQAMLAFWRAWPAFVQALRTDMAGSMTLTQITPFGQVPSALLAILGLGGVLSWAAGKVGARRAAQLSALTMVGVLAAFTLRTMIMLNYINPELGKEFMVYAHATPDVKFVLRQVEEISWRTTGTPRQIKVAYGQDGSWPFYWYMRTQYPNSYYYESAPDPDLLLECPAVIAGRDQWTAVAEILGDEYVGFDYKFLWWPIEDYKGLTWQRVREVWNDPEMRGALWDIFIDRDYTRYAQLKNPENPFTLKTWPHREDFRFYVRRDLAAQILSEPEATSASAPSAPEGDAYAEGTRTLTASSVAVLPGSAPRGLAAAPDGTLYVADTAQHRVWHITPQGQVLRSWGEYGVGPGQFHEPWDVAVDAEGHIYVADTWNHRVQKFTAAGEPLLHWGQLAQVQSQQEGAYGMFYGPRGIAVGPEGLIYVTDTGNRRVQVFDGEGQFQRAFGRGGSETSELEEPVGIAVSAAGEIFVADTWNRRVQVFTLSGLYAREWPVAAWGSGNAEEKPYLALGEDEAVYVSDPVYQRVLAFTATGDFIWALDAGSLAFPEGLAVIGDTLYVADAHNGQVLGYTPPE